MYSTDSYNTAFLRNLTTVLYGDCLHLLVIIPGDISSTYYVEDPVPGTWDTSALWSQHSIDSVHLSTILVGSWLARSSGHGIQPQWIPDAEYLKPRGGIALGKGARLLPSGSSGEPWLCHGLAGSPASHLTSLPLVFHLHLSSWKNIHVPYSEHCW